MVARWLSRSDSRSEGVGCGRLEGDGGMVGRLFGFVLRKELYLRCGLLECLRGQMCCLPVLVLRLSVSVSAGVGVGARWVQECYPGSIGFPGK